MTLYFLSTTGKVVDANYRARTIAFLKLIYLLKVIDKKHTINIVSQFQIIIV